MRASFLGLINTLIIAVLGMCHRNHHWCDRRRFAPVQQLVGCQDHGRLCGNLPQRAGIDLDPDHHVGVYRQSSAYAQFSWG